MPLRFLLDENVPARIWQAIQRHNLSGADPIDVVRVGDSEDLPLGIGDPEILLWAEREDRILVTNDRSTMAAHLDAHLEAGHNSPGLFLIRPGTDIPRLVEFLAVATQASRPEEWRDRIEYVP